jgi:hypothetical protein
MNYPDYVPEWYNPRISYAIMQKYGDKSKELEKQEQFILAETYGVK